MKSRIQYILIFFSLSLVTTSQAQFDTLNQVFKPRIGLGTGTLTYFGEIQDYQKGFSSTINRIGGNLMINAPLTKAFNAEFSAIYGKVSANERGLERNLNFESRIRMSSFMIHYNFYPFFSSTRSFFNPYVGIGISSFEFLSKTDLYNGSGIRYHYWNDGSIMNMAQDDPGAANAQRVSRDYFYETDLREQNFDSLGKYKEQSFAIPLSFGAEFHLTPRVDFRINTTLNYTFTDLIDNISPSGTGLREGDARNDFLLYTSVGISYDLEIKKGGAGSDLLDEFMLAEYDQTDWDKDGVIDALDDCPWTPIEALVDSAGCPIDSDGDGVPDYFDEEVTPFGNHVDEYGITITEAEFLRWQELMMDSTGLAYGFVEDFAKSDHKNAKGQTVKGGAKVAKKNYVVVLGKEHKSITASELHRYLGYKDFETVTKGDTVYYVLGKYEKIEDAVAAKSSLEQQGVVVDEIGKINRNETDVMPVNEKVVEKIEKINLSEGKALPEFKDDEVTFRLLIGESETDVPAKEKFPTLENVNYAKGEDGIIRYYYGTYDNYKDAKNVSEDLAEKGIGDNNVIAYKNQERVTLKEAGVVILPKGYDEQTELESFVEKRIIDTTSTSTSIDAAKVNYLIFLGSYQEKVPISDLQIYLSIDGVKPVVKSDGSTTYYSKLVNTEAEAQTLLESYKTYQLENLSIMVKYEGKYYTLEEFKDLK